MSNNYAYGTTSSATGTCTGSPAPTMFYEEVADAENLLGIRMLQASPDLSNQGTEMSRISRAWLAVPLAGSLLLLAVSTAQGEPKLDSGEYTTAWMRASASDGSRPPGMNRGTRRIRISYAVDVCSATRDPTENVSRIDVRRRAKSIIITVILREDPAPPGEVCPGVAKQMTSRVELKGRLGCRSIKDGALSPARTVVGTRQRGCR